MTEINWRDRAPPEWDEEYKSMWIKWHIVQDKLTDARAEIKKLKAERLNQPPPQWISVEDRLPDNERSVYVVVEKKKVSGNIVYDHDEDFYCDSEWEFCGKDVKVWMDKLPLPPAPEVE